MSDEQARFCSLCGHSLVVAEAGTQHGEAARVFPAKPHYAGFWRRFLAIIIDEIVLVSVSFILSASYLMTVRTGPDSEAFAITVMGNRIFTFLLQWLYFTIMESSSKQATLGKMAIGIIVTDYGGRRISFLRANGRYFGKFLSWFIFGIGFLMAGFTRKKQALHDMLAETLVVVKEKPE